MANKDDEVKKDSGVKPALSNGLEARIAELVEKYRLNAKMTVEQYVDAGLLILEAEGEIGKNHLHTFYDAIGMRSDGSKAKKMRKIGEKHTRFLPYLDRLPNCWTTLYNLALVPEERYMRLIDDGILNQNSTWADLRPHCVDAKPAVVKKPRPRITLDLEPVPLAKRGRFAKALTSILAEFSVALADAQKATLDEFVPVLEEGS